ncbi:hypothetical protein EFD56_27915 [Rhizobium phaseoli]|uniref:hypothetical protein n=1 Tax=Rhizobium phaseoli TaxID=396 RepID=UPI000F871B3B|nr:hypothetical protein [Rhizobium phaseoli]RUM13483.1 hypothetical protein EFD56_27915 [Rhizobium phaseoli]
MLHLTVRRNLSVIIAFAASYSVASGMTAYEARDVCVGLAAAYINAQDKTHFTYINGKFKVEGDAKQITIFENAVPVATIPKFEYDKYTECLEKMAR